MKPCPFLKRNWWTRRCECKIHENPECMTILGECKIHENPECMTILGKCNRCCLFCWGDKMTECWKKVAMSNVEKLIYYNWRNNESDTSK
jgi:hypothetical protein